MKGSDQNAELQKQFETEAFVHLNTLYSGALRLTRNPGDAEDLVQDTFTRAYMNFHRYELGTNCRAWLFRIMMNTFINQYRRRKKEREILQRKRRGTLKNELVCKEQHDRNSDPELTVIYSGLGKEVRAAIDGLSSDFKTVVLLSDLHGFAYREIAEMMDTPIGTVMSRLFRGRRMLRTRLDAYARAQGVLPAASQERDTQAS
jgi:RNA polymerase sigma-70 factor (ECF subfamily)